MNGTQLQLLSEPVPGNIYRVGDLVKLRRKPAIAAHIKRGECFEVNAIHPKDGSVRIWNPHINQWDFLYPDEIKLTKSLTSKVTVESVVEQITTPLLTVESVVEQIATPQSTVEPVVEQIPRTQLTVEPVVEQIDKIYNCNGWLETHYKIRRGGKQHCINCPEIGCTGPYYMYRWREGKKQRAKYCPANKCPAVHKAMTHGCPINEILKIISNQ